MVSLLEPFIDTLVICTITGLVILASGAWTMKFDNQFQQADMVFLAGALDEQQDADRAQLVDYLVHGNDEAVTLFDGNIGVTAGRISEEAPTVTVIHARSVAEELYFTQNGAAFDGNVRVVDGKLADATLTVSGKSLLHSAALTTRAFSFSYFGEAGQYIVALSLVLFAFSTSISWSYYGDRAITYLVGTRWIQPYRVVYCIGFFVAAVADTTVVWNIAAVGIVVMTLPNLLAIMLLRKEVRGMVSEYWQGFKK
jgi:AGCS family alanine or glycine:cation symporter